MAERYLYRYILIKKKARVNHLLPRNDRVYGTSVSLGVGCVLLLEVLFKGVGPEKTFSTGAQSFMRGAYLHIYSSPITIFCR